jgi:hypothetical protein
MPPSPHAPPPHMPEIKDFIPRKQSSKPNARGTVRNNKHKTKYLFTYLHFIIEFNSLFIFVISLDYDTHLIKLE